MKSKLREILRTNKLLYKIYFYFGSALLSFFSIFIRINKYLILFNSFNGNKYDDSPKVIYEKIINDIRFKDYKFVWVFCNPEKFEIPVCKKIKVNTVKYFYYMLKSKCWIANSTIENRLKFKKKNNIHLNTNHGTPIKKMGFDDNMNCANWSVPNIDIQCAQSNYEADIWVSAFKTNRDRIIISGLPRNDILANYSEDMKLQIMNKLRLPKDKKIILYCPTWRDYSINGNYSIEQHFIDIKKWENKIKNDYIILFRAHHATAKTLNIECDNFIYNFSEYECLNDLMIVSDILISDYSSVYFDYSIMTKPMLCFAHDYEKYMENRGMYIDIRKELPCEVAYDEDTLLGQIINLNYDEMSEKTLKFRDKYVEAFGNATDICVDKIWENIKDK